VSHPAVSSERADHRDMPAVDQCGASGRASLDGQKFRVLPDESTFNPLRTDHVNADGQLLSDPGLKQSDPRKTGIEGCSLHRILMTISTPICSSANPGANVNRSQTTTDTNGPKGDRTHHAHKLLPKSSGRRWVRHELFFQCGVPPVCCDVIAKAIWIRSAGKNNAKLELAGQRASNRHQISITYNSSHTSCIASTG